MDATLFLSHPIIQIFTMLMLLAFLFVIIGLSVNAEIILSPIKGFMAGALVHNETYINEENEEVTEYTLQCLIFFISVNVLWEKRGG